MCSGERCPRRSPVKRPSAAGGSGEKPPRPAHEARGLSTPEAPSAAVDCKFSSDATAMQSRVLIANSAPMQPRMLIAKSASMQSRTERPKFDDRLVHAVHERETAVQQSSIDAKVM